MNDQMRNAAQALVNACTTKDDLKEISEMVSHAWNAMSRAATRQIVEGTAMSFEARGMFFEGIVEKVNVKSVKLNCGWKVTGDLLTEIEDGRAFIRGQKVTHPAEAEVCTVADLWQAGKLISLRRPNGTTFSYPRAEVKHASQH